MKNKKRIDTEESAPEAAKPKVVEPELASEEESPSAPHAPLEPEVVPEDLPLEPAEVEVLGPEELSEEQNDSREIVPYDPLDAYLREIRRYPKLSREEEHELAVSYFQNKDVEAAYKLVSANLWLVVKIARDYSRAARNVLDLIQEGNIGLMEAVRNFDPYRGVRFPSYAVWWIKAYIVRFVIANWRLVKIGTTQAQRKLFFNLKREQERLIRAGFKPEPKLLAEKLNVRESDVVEMEQRLASHDLSVDAPIDQEGETTLLSVLPSSESSAEEALGDLEVQEMLKRSLKEFESILNPKELLIFESRMLSEEKATLQEISEKLEVSRERVRQIETRVREKLKEFLEQKLGPVLEQIKF